MVRTFSIFGALLAGVAVMAGAFGAHALKTKLTPDVLQTFEVAVRYQMYHALGLFVIAWAYSRHATKGLKIAGWLFIAGIVLFSGSLYAYTLTTLNGEGVKALGMITPFGGVCFMVGWLLVGLSALRWPRE